MAGSSATDGGKIQRRFYITKDVPLRNVMEDVEREVERSEVLHARLSEWLG